MGVISCKLLRTGRRLSVAADRSRKYVHEWQVQTDDPSMGLQSILNGSVAVGPDPIPVHQSYYNIDGDTDLGVLLQTVEVSVGPERDDNFYFYTIKGTWDPPPKGQGRDPLPENPLDWPTKWHAETSKFTRKAVRDAVYNANGEPTDNESERRLILNSAGDLFENIEVDDGREIVTAVRNEFPLSAIFQKMRYYKNAVASDEFMGAEPLAAKMDSITLGQLTVTNDIEYYPVTYRVEFAEDGKIWPKRFDNRGNMAFDRPKADGGVKGRVRVLAGDRKGEFKEWAFLDEDGVQLSDFNVPSNVIPWPPEDQQPYHLNPIRPFAALGLA